jgi:hypothetical protein
MTASSGLGQLVLESAGDSKVHVIYTALTDDNEIGQLIRINVPKFEELIRFQIREERLGSFTMLLGADCTAENLLATVDSLNLRSIDVVFVYYEGHGAYDPNAPESDPDKGHYLALPDRQLPRGELIARMQRKNPRLAVLLTDCCNVEGVVEIPQRAVYETKIVTVTGFTAMEDLLLSYRGLVDGTASSEGEYSWFSNDVGGWYTSEFIGNVYALTDQRIPWEEFWERMRDVTEAFFQEHKVKWGHKSAKLAAQDHMRPLAFRLEVVRDAPTDEPLNTRELQYPVQALVAQ